MTAQLVAETFLSNWPDFINLISLKDGLALLSLSGATLRIVATGITSICRPLSPFDVRRSVAPGKFLECNPRGRQAKRCSRRQVRHRRVHDDPHRGGAAS